MPKTGNTGVASSKELTNFPADNAAIEPPEISNPGARRPLLRKEAVEKIREGLTLAGASAAIDAFLVDVDKHADYLERCCTEAESVLRGILDASNRLWLLLQTPVESRLRLPESILGDGGHDILRRAPIVIDGDTLLRLVAGVTRAANQPSEAEVMLKVLGQLLQPLFRLDLVDGALQRARLGHAEMLETLVTAQLTPQWVAALENKSPPVSSEVFVSYSRPRLSWLDYLLQFLGFGSRSAPILTRDVRILPDKVTLDPNRVAYDSTSWLKPRDQSTLEHWNSLWPCPGGVHTSFSETNQFGSRYHIDSISPSNACPGQALVITGTDFSATDRVTFPAPDANDPIFAAGIPEEVLLGVKPISSTSIRIEVVVPFWAIAGELQLNAFTIVETVCATIEFHRLGNSVLFGGGRAAISQVILDQVDVDLTGVDPPSLALGRPAVTLSWRTTGGSETLVNIQLADDVRVFFVRTNLPGGFGSITFNVPITDPEKPRIGHLTFSLTSSCGQSPPLDVPVWLNVPPRLTIEYVEVTQGVQTELADVLAGRGMPTVANKDTVIRVHMQCDRGGWFSNQLANITGTLLVDDRKLPPTNFANIAGFSNPSNTNDTLNFTIPAAWLQKGVHQLTVNVFCNDRSGIIRLQSNFPWTWYAKDPLKVRAIYMASDPSEPAMLDYTRKALDYPPHRPEQHRDRVEAHVPSHKRSLRLRPLA